MGLTALERLRLFLRPPSQGGTLGKASVDSLQATELWEDSLQKIRRSKTILVGIPSDLGSSYSRGAAMGPMAIRTAYLSSFGNLPREVVDVGDVVCVPQLLHDGMLSESQIQATRAALYPGVSEALPVGTLSIAESVMEALSELNPHAKIVVLGGDNSVSWPAILYCSKVAGDDFGVVHFDAHTDLMEQRFGVNLCYATWAYHGMQLAKPGNFVQVGIRTPGHDKAYWEQKYPVKQFLASEILGQELKIAELIIEYFLSRKVTRLYISNDIEATEIAGVPARELSDGLGLKANFVKRLVRALGENFDLIGGDIVELAPGHRTDFSGEPACLLSADYLQTLFESVRP